MHGINIIDLWSITCLLCIRKWKLRAWQHRRGPTLILTDCMWNGDIVTFSRDEVQRSRFLWEDRTHQPQEPEEPDERFGHSRHGSGAPALWKEQAEKSQVRWQSSKISSYIHFVNKTTTLIDSKASLSSPQRLRSAIKSSTNRIRVSQP